MLRKATNRKMQAHHTRDLRSLTDKNTPPSPRPWRAGESFCSNKKKSDETSPPRPQTTGPHRTTPKVQRRSPVRSLGTDSKPRWGASTPRLFFIDPTRPITDLTKKKPVKKQHAPRSEGRADGPAFHVGNQPRVCQEKRKADHYLNRRTLLGKRKSAKARRPNKNRQAPTTSKPGHSR